MSELVVEPFVNQFNQTINPGDPVIYAGSSWKTTTFRKGKFAGVYYEMRTRHMVRKDEKGEPIRDERGYLTHDTVLERVQSAVKISDVEDTKWVWDNETRKGQHVPCLRTATLPLKRVFRLDSPLADLHDVSF